MARFLAIGSERGERTDFLLAENEETTTSPTGIVTATLANGGTIWVNLAHCVYVSFYEAAEPADEAEESPPKPHLIAVPGIESEESVHGK